MRSALPIGACLALLLVLPAAAQERPGQRELKTKPLPVRPSRAVPSTTTAPVRSATTLLGARIVLRPGEAPGRVSDIVFTDRGTIDYLVVRSGDNFVIQPWRSIRIDAAGRLSVVRTPAIDDRVRSLVVVRDPRRLRLQETIWGPQPVGTRPVFPEPWDRSGSWLRDRIADRELPGLRPADILKARLEEREAPPRLPPPLPPLPTISGDSIIR
jgi:hypothetical protein